MELTQEEHQRAIEEHQRAIELRRLESIARTTLETFTALRWLHRDGLCTDKNLKDAENAYDTARVAYDMIRFPRKPS
jgi:hypothetical protein